MAFNLSSPSPSAITPLSAHSNPRHALQSNLKLVRYRVRCSLESESSSADVPDTSPEPITTKTQNHLTSRRRCLACLTSSIALISNSSSPRGKAIASDMKPGCRNCGGSGAIICEILLNALIAMEEGNLYVLFVWVLVYPTIKVFLGGLMPNNCLKRCIMGAYFQTLRCHWELGFGVILEYGK
ncbi:unnamed protein product [Lactuca virosa]|uniref:Uncharacterized protein n=1 Tax=Lactuca virosa TaxID=75947 RepID=A0AAU9NUT0_9ASTR|nr:unnamed protein product [Lactuca virosa]